MGLLLYLFPIGALVFQLIAFSLALPQMALLALVLPMVFIPQVALLMHRRYGVQAKPLIMHTIIAFVLLIASSLLMLWY